MQSELMAEAGQHVTLGKTGLKVSRICFGTWQLSPSYWGEQPHRQIIDAMGCARELGINFIDTADAYGDGLSERVVGQALRELSREDFVVATKVFWHIGGEDRRYPDLSPDYIARACEASLQRLQTDHIDLYQCHSFDPLVHPNQIVQAMEKLIRQGKIRACGTSNWTVEQMRLGEAAGQCLGSCQPHYSLMKTDIEKDVLPYCQRHGLGVLVYSPLHYGLLSGKYRGDETFADVRRRMGDFQGQRFKEVCDRVRQVGEVGQPYGLTTVQTVLRATLMHPAVHCAIVGIKDSDQIREAAGAVGAPLEREDYFQVRKLLQV